MSIQCVKRDREVLRYGQKAARGASLQYLKALRLFGPDDNTVSRRQKPLTEAHSCCKIRPAAQSGRGTNGPTSGWASGSSLPIYWEIDLCLFSLFVCDPPPPPSPFFLFCCLNIDFFFKVTSSWQFCFSKWTHFDFSQKVWNVDLSVSVGFLLSFSYTDLFYASKSLKWLSQQQNTLLYCSPHTSYAALYQNVWVSCPRNVPIFSLCEWNGKCEFTRNVGFRSLDEINNNFYR